MGKRQYYNRLLQIIGLGQNAAAGVGNTGVQTASDIAQTDVSAASGMASIYGNAANGYLNNSNYQNAFVRADAQRPCANEPRDGRRCDGLGLEDFTELSAAPFEMDAA